MTITTTPSVCLRPPRSEVPVNDTRGTDAAEAGVAALFRREYTGLVRMATLLLGDEASAEDVVQDAFVAVYRRWGRLEDQDRAGGYLRRAVVNGSRSQLRRRGTATRLAVRLHEDEAEGDTTAEESIVADRRAAVIRALGALPRRQREVLVLRYYLDLPEAEIARTLGIGRGSVKTHASRGSRALRAGLEER